MCIHTCRDIPKVSYIFVIYYIYVCNIPFLSLSFIAPSISFLMTLITSVQLPIQSHSRRIFRNVCTKAVYWEPIRRNLFRATAFPTFSTSTTYFRKHSAQFLLLNFRLESLSPYGGSLAVPLAASRTFWQVGLDRDASRDFDQLGSRARRRPRSYGRRGSDSCYERVEIRLDS